MATTVHWDGDRWAAAFQTVINQGLTEAAGVVADRMARNFGTEGGGVIGPDGKLINILSAKKDLAKRRKLRQKQRYASAPPGAYPGVRLGHLRRSISYVAPEASGVPNVALAGTNVAYGRYLEFGTLNMPARPWALRSAFDARPAASVAFRRAVVRGLDAIGKRFRKGAA